MAPTIEREQPENPRREAESPFVGAIAVKGGDDDPQPVTVRIGEEVRANPWDTTAEVLDATPHLGKLARADQTAFEAVDAEPEVGEVS